jgi:hypothetical protein
MTISVDTPSFAKCSLLCNPIFTMRDFLWVVCSVMVPWLMIYGAVTKPRAPCGGRHMVVLLGTHWYHWLLARLYYRTTPMCHLIMSLSLIVYPNLIKRSLLHAQVRELPMKLQRGLPLKNGSSTPNQKDTQHLMLDKLSVEQASIITIVLMI